MFKKFDDQFVDAAADSARRTAAIAHLTRGRRQAFFGASVLFGANFIAIFDC